jgi:hypothetical protein
MMRMSARLVLFAATVGYLTAQSRNARVVDLTGAPPRHSIGVPGARYSGCSGCIQQQYVLPLKLEIERIDSTNDGDVLIELLLTNTGASLFRLPTERASDILERPGTGRRTFSFALSSEDPLTHEVRQSVVAVTHAIDSGPKSYLELLPGESAHVKLLWNRNNQSNKVDLGKTWIVAECSEYKIENDVFVIKEWSKQVSSNKTLFEMK